MLLGNREKIFILAESEGQAIDIPGLLCSLEWHNGFNQRLLSLLSRSLSDLSDRSEQSGKARTDWPDFEAHSHSMQRKIGVI